MPRTDLPTLEEIKTICAQGHEIDGGAHRVVFRKPGSDWVIKVDYEKGKVNQREYDNYQRFSSTLSNERVKFPEMHMVGPYLVAEYIDGSHGNLDCWGNAQYREGKAHYVNGCDAGEACTAGELCWAELTREASQHIADLHYKNVKVTSESTVYVIDIGEH